jgi:hypothetical protein
VVDQDSLGWLQMFVDQLDALQILRHQEYQ